MSLTSFQSSGEDPGNDLVVRCYDAFSLVRQVLLFSQEDRWNIFKMLAAILHIGNLEFEGRTRFKLFNFSSKP